MRNLADEFKTFLLRGNLIELAVAIVIGVAFTDVVRAVVEDLITPLIAAIGGEPDFSALSFTINGSVFKYGDFINKLVAFFTVALVIFFLVIKPANLLVARMRREPPPDPTLRKCLECLESIPSAARRCRYCTSEVEPLMSSGAATAS
jgi:large conductance mechanosensitive channel